MLYHTCHTCSKNCYFCPSICNYTQSSPFSLIKFLSYGAFRSPIVPCTYRMGQQLVLPLHNVYNTRSWYHGGWTYTWKNYILKVVPTSIHLRAANFYYWIIGAHHWLSTHSHRSPTSTKQNILPYYKYSLTVWLSSSPVWFLEREVLGSNFTRNVKIFISLITLIDAQR